MPHVFFEHFHTISPTKHAKAASFMPLFEAFADTLRNATPDCK